MPCKPIANFALHNQANNKFLYICTVQNARKHNLKAFFMLFIITISSIGMPLITHSCSHDNKKDIHIFSSENQCKDACCAVEVINDVLSFNDAPCCSFETSFLKNENHISPQIELTKKQIIILSSLFFQHEIIEDFISKKLEHKSFHHKSFGYKYRIALQSFLC